ncbi:hypothetical protein CLU79DRAFT_789637 [Phycomyces nitens]|nr:hypothetical protein CLU79DRAFT_789637 [Phycomyces nitens]
MDYLFVQSQCTEKDIALSFVPMGIFSFATSYLISYRWGSKEEFSWSSTETKTQKIFRPLQYILCLVQAVVWGYYFLSGPNGTKCAVIDSVSPLLIWCFLFVLSITGPRYTHFSSRHHLHFFTSVFFLAFLDAAYRIFSSTRQISEYTKDVYFLIGNLVITFALLMMTGLTAQPINPKNMETENDEKVDIKDGEIYRNNHRLSPEASSSLFGWIFFSWMNPLMYFGFSNELKQDNLYSLTYNHLTRFTFKEYMNIVTPPSRSSIIFRLFKVNKNLFVFQIITALSVMLLSYLNPFFQQKILEYIADNKGQPISTAYTYVFGMFFAGLIKVVFSGVKLWIDKSWQVRMFMMLDAELYAKTLKHKDMSGKVDEESEDDEANDEKSFTSVGKITNLMSIDADGVAFLSNDLSPVYIAPLEIIVCVLYLYQLLGFAAIAGVSIMLMFSPLSTVMANMMSKRYMEFSASKDKRNALVNELLQGIRMIKYFAWEDNWEKKVIAARNIELKKLLRTLYIDIANSIIYLSVPAMVSSVSFIWYTKIAGNELTASVAFVSITLFEMLRGPLTGIPETIRAVTETYVCLDRIESYMKEADIGAGVSNEPIPVPEGVSPASILARVGSEESVFRWHSGEPETVDSVHTEENSTEHPVFSLRLPAFEFPTSEFSIVCGPTGSGKSSFLNALLGEMDIVSGRVYLPSKTKLAIDKYSVVDPEYPSLYLDKVAYVAQQAYLQHASIRNNILFGQEFDLARYKKVLFQCALVKDLSIFADGDRTEIGEKGISLSGGQKQRVALARAVYSRAKTVLLDDCLSAVDAHTAKHIYEYCLKGDLMKGRTVILVTHHVRLCLPTAKFVMRIERGAVAGCGFVDTFREDGTLIQLLGDEIAENGGSSEEFIEQISEEFDLIDDDAVVNNMIKEEKSEKGQVKYKVYMSYFYACGGWSFWGLLLLSYFISRGFVFGENWWLRIWAARKGASENPAGIYTADVSPLVYFDQAIKSQGVFQSWVHEDDQPRSVDYYIIVYLCICFGVIFVNALRKIWLFLGSVRGGRILFHAMLHRIMHSPMRFFDTTPIGRILNRFGKDIVSADLSVASSLGRLLEYSTSFIASVVVICVITPQFTIAVAFIGIIYVMVGTLYLRASRQFKRINSVNLSPIYSHFTETLMGLATIRAYCKEEMFELTFYKKIDTYISSFYLLWMSNRWLYARIEFIGSFVTLITGICILLNISSIDAGMAGILLFYARSLLDAIYWLIRQYTQVEMELNSVERVQEYLELEQEAPPIIKGSRPPAAWPTTASVEVKDLAIKYAEHLDPVLHEISFDIRSHEKVGVVGRTGSGKSTLALSFFRFLEPTNGSIFIDGIDISHIGLQDLRSKLTIIPQDAILFSGTIRSNLDPFEEYTDSAVWESLVRAHLSPKNRDEEVPEGNAKWGVTSLTQTVSDGGNNFSQGQRQLLCMARALLKNSRLIIMDEATASVDFETDKKIQNTIREEFVHSTLICIAHRLRTIIDYDRVLVMDQGNVVEYDTPANLLLNNAGTGLFKSMCEKSGELDVLIEMAHSSEMRDGAGKMFEQADHHTPNRQD